MQETGAQVAVKVLNRQSELRAIQNEIEAVRRIPRHDNIVQFLAYEEEVCTYMHMYAVYMGLHLVGSTGVHFPLLPHKNSLVSP